jgi:hypothetical protein
MLRITSDPVFLPPDVRHVHMLFPWWGILSKRFEVDEIFDDYMKYGKDIFSWVDNLADADFAVLPASWERYTLKDCEALADEYFSKARAAGVPVLAFTTDDPEWDIHSAGVTHFRYAVTRKTRLPHVYAMPSFTRDISREAGSGWYAREKTDTPVLGFCGGAGWSLLHEFRFIRLSLARLRGRIPNTYNPPVRASAFYRLRLLRVAESQTEIQTNFIVQPIRYSQTKRNQLDPAQRRQVRDIYRSNMLNSDYVLCMRGAANYSLRFYETLSAGRVPVVIESDAVFPFEEFIPYGEMMVWVPEEDAKKMGAYIADFHSRFTSKQFIELQHELRNIWLTWLSPRGFFQNLYRCLT